MFDDPAVIQKIGLVHVSGVEASIPKSQFSDAHRVLPGPADVMNSAALMAKLEKTGYRGMYSFEPFSAEVQALGAKELASALRASIEYLSHA